MGTSKKAEAQAQNAAAIVSNVVVTVKSVSIHDYAAGDKVYEIVRIGFRESVPGYEKNDAGEYVEKNVYAMFVFRKSFITQLCEIVPNFAMLYDEAKENAKAGIAKQEEATGVELDSEEKKEFITTACTKFLNAILKNARLSVTRTFIAAGQITKSFSGKDIIHHVDKYDEDITAITLDDAVAKAVAPIVKKLEERIAKDLADSIGL